MEETDADTQETSKQRGCIGSNRNKRLAQTTTLVMQMMETLHQDDLAPTDSRSIGWTEPLLKAGYPNAVS